MVYFNFIEEFKFDCVKHKTNSGDISEQILCVATDIVFWQKYILHTLQNGNRD